MIGGKGKLRLTKRFRFLAILLAAFVLLPATTFAQDLPCTGDDPFGSCPLDTNVWILVIVALFAGAVFIYKQQKTAHNRA